MTTYLEKWAQENGLAPTTPGLDATRPDRRIRARISQELQENNIDPELAATASLAGGLGLGALSVGSFLRNKLKEDRVEEARSDLLKGVGALGVGELISYGMSGSTTLGDLKDLYEGKQTVLAPVTRVGANEPSVDIGGYMLDLSGEPKYPTNSLFDRSMLKSFWEGRPNAELLGTRDVRVPYGQQQNYMKVIEENAARQGIDPDVLAESFVNNSKGGKIDIVPDLKPNFLKNVRNNKLQAARVLGGLGLSGLGIGHFAKKYYDAKADNTPVLSSLGL